MVGEASGGGSGGVLFVLRASSPRWPKGPEDEAEVVAFNLDQVGLLLEAFWRRLGR